MAAGDIGADILNVDNPYFKLGMNLDTYDNNTILDTHLNYLIEANIPYVRCQLLGAESAGEIAASKDDAAYCVSKGFKVLWGLSSGITLTAANWSDYSDAILAAAAWAEANGIYEFQIGNELEGKVDGTTLTVGDLITNLKTLATAVQAVYTIGKVSYATYTYNNLQLWKAAGKGDLDILALNWYQDNNFRVFKNVITEYYTSFGEDSYLTEFSLSYRNIDYYTSDEKEQERQMQEIIGFLKGLGMKRAYFFRFYDDTLNFGVLKADGVTFRQMWNVFKNTNTIQPFVDLYRKTANDKWLISPGKDGQVYTVHIEEAP